MGVGGGGVAAFVTLLNVHGGATIGTNVDHC